MLTILILSHDQFQTSSDLLHHLVLEVCWKQFVQIIHRSEDILVWIAYIHLHENFISNFLTGIIKLTSNLFFTVFRLVIIGLLKKEDSLLEFHHHLLIHLYNYSDCVLTLVGVTSLKWPSIVIPLKISILAYFHLNSKPNLLFSPCLSF